jgi:hypothetical protein
MSRCSAHNDLKAPLVEQGSIGRLVGLMQSRSEAAQYRALKAVAHIGKVTAFRARVVEAGALQPLVLLCLSNDRKMQGMAAGTCANICADGASFALVFFLLLSLASLSLSCRC